MSTAGRVAVAVAVAACSSTKAPDPCATAFHTVQPFAFGGATYAGPPALMFGMTCPALTGEDYECIARVTDKESLKKCTHAMKAISDRVAGPGPTDVSPYAADDFARIADAVCACPDTDCILAVGQREHAFEIPRKPFADGSPGKAAEERLKTCLKNAKPPVR